MDNDQARGYAILAMVDAGLKNEDIAKAVRSMHYMFDLKTEEEAEDQGREAYYKITSRL
jgi:hypothetical protein